MRVTKITGENVLMYAVLIVILIGVFTYFVIIGAPAKTAQTSTLKAPMVIFGGASTIQNDSFFISNAESVYNLTYATQSDYSRLLKSTIIILYVNSSSNDNLSTFGKNFLSSKGIDIAAYRKGFDFYFSNVWARDQEVYVLLNTNASATAKALSSFFSKPTVTAPDPQTLKRNTITNFTRDPLLDGIYIGGYQCPNGCPLDMFTNLPYPLNYYVNFSYAFYLSDAGFFTGGGSHLPSSVGFCSPPTPGACVGVYVGAPVFQVNHNFNNLVTPLLGLFNVNVSTTLGIEEGEEGTVTEGSFLLTDFSLSPGPNGSFGNETINYLWTPLSQLIKDGVTMYSSPLYPLPFFDWVYGLYPLLQTSSNMGNISGLTQTQYVNIFYPFQLSAPQQIVNSSGTWTFSAWSVYEEIGNNTYYQTLNYSTVPFYVQGPVQAQAIYTYNAPPRPGSISGYVEYAYSIFNSYLNVSSLGPAITGVSLSFYNGSNLITTATSNQNGFYSTPTLNEGCYNVSISIPPYYQGGLSMYPEYTPVCVYGDITYNIYEFSHPYAYANGPLNMYQSYLAMPFNQTVPIYLHMYWPDGNPAVNFSASTMAGSGSLSGGISNSSGTIRFNWTAGNVPGSYNLTFFRFLGKYLLSTTMRVNVLNLSLSSPYTSIPVTNGSNVSVPLGLIVEGNNYYPPSISGANVSISGLPAGTTAKFLPNPMNTYSNTSVLLDIGKSVPAGMYNLRIKAVDDGPSYWNSPLIAYYNFRLNVSSCTNRLGGISGQVLNLDGNPTAANLTIANSSGVVDRIRTSNGIFNTGYVLRPGVYNLSSYGLYGTGIYFSKLVNVTACSLSNQILAKYGALTVTVIQQNGAPAIGANVTLSGPNYFRVLRTANSVGQVVWGYSLNPGTYSLYVNYKAVNVSAGTISLEAAVNQEVNVTV